MASPHLCSAPARSASPTPTHPAPRPFRRVGRLGLTVLLTAAASIGLTLVPGNAGALPTQAVTQAGTAREATQMVAEAQQRLEAVSEQVNEAQVTLEQQQAAGIAAAEAATAAVARQAAVDAQMRQVARSAFTGENLSRFTALMTSGSADEFLAQVTTLDALAGHTGDILAQASAAADVAAEARTAADAAAATAQQTLAQVTAQQAELKSRIADYQAQYAALSAAEQAAANRAHAGTAVASTAAGSGSRSTSSGASTAGLPPAPSGAAQKAVDTALAQIGDPYVWGAGGPNSFDCSGLVQYAYAAAGVSLPHSSRIQSTMGTAVARRDLQPGDLVFFHSPVSHVGMYVGNGRMVHAATFGVPVQVVSVDMKGYVGARRLVGG